MTSVDADLRSGRGLETGRRSESIIYMKRVNIKCRSTKSERQNKTKQGKYKIITQENAKSKSILQICCNCATYDIWEEFWSSYLY